MIYFICWVVFLFVLILSVGVAQLMSNRANRPTRSRAVAEDASFEEDVAVVEGEESLEEADAVESFDEFPADEMPVDGDQPADDFAAFEEEFK